MREEIQRQQAHNNAGELVEWRFLCTKAGADKIEALLRFQSAMTPEMWEILRFDHEMNPSEERLSRKAWAALDTLRQELQQS